MENAAEIRARALEKIRKQNPDLYERIQTDPNLIRGLARKELEQRKRCWPCKDAVPNWGQERGLEPLRHPHSTYGDFPHGLILTGGNGAGKTWCIPQTIVGTCIGKEYLSEEWFGDFEFFDKFEALRRERQIFVRIVCDKADVTDSGSIVQQMKKWIPLCEPEGMEGGHYTRIRLPNPDPKVYHDVVIDIKTHGQPITASAGPDIDLLIFNEPPPLEIFNENTSRLRLGGYYMAFLTPLYLASYLWDVIHGDRPEGEIVHHELSIWDNWIERRGVLTKEAIERQIRDWEATKPLEVPARRDGKFSFLAGAVFPIFRETEHMMHEDERFLVKSNWNVFHGCDPHPVKPHVGLWIANDPTNTVRVIAEYPTEPWEHLGRNYLGISQFGEVFDHIESGRHPKFLFGRRLHVLLNVGDPNAMRCRAQGSSSPMATIASEYAEKCGREYDLSAPDSVEMRHERITEMLYWDRDRPLSPTNRPRLLISPACRNMRAALQGYMFKSQTDQGSGQGLSDKVEAKWECWIATLGYLLLVIPQWSPIVAGGYHDDYEEYLYGREHDDHDDRPSATTDQRVLCQY